MTTPAYWNQAKAELSAADPVLGRIIADYPGELLTSRGDAFYTLARSIVGQQVSVKAADSMWNKFDFFIVVASLLDIALSFFESSFSQFVVIFRVQKMLRLLRISRMIKLVKSLKASCLPLCCCELPICTLCQPVATLHAN